LQSLGHLRTGSGPAARPIEPPSQAGRDLFMSQTVRYVLFIASSIAILLVWNFLFPPPKPAPKPSPTPMASASPTTTPSASPTPAPEGAGSTIAPAPAEAPKVAGPPVEVGTALWKAIFNPKGAGLDSFVLSGDKQSVRGHKDQGMNLAHSAENQPRPLSVDLTALAPGLTPEAIYETVGTPTGNELTFKTTSGPVTVTKHFTWKPDTYQLHLDVTVTGANPGTYPVKALYTAYEVPTSSGGFFSFGAHAEPHQVVCHIAGARSMESIPFSANKVQMETFPGTPAFTGVDEKYFISALSPGQDASPSTCAIGTVGEPSHHRAVLERTLTVAAGQPATTSFDIFIGPKDSDALEAAGHELKKSVDFGFLDIICRALLYVLRLFETFVRNWGVAIILLTLLVKIITFPLTHKQMVSMEEGKRLNPLVEKLKEKYAGDQTRINMETMKLYKEHNYQPLAGCFPMLIQMPVWFALYRTLSNSFELYNEPFIGGWLTDLTQRDPYYVLPVAMTATMFLTQILTPQPQQNQQMKTMTYIMPLMFGVFMLNLPSGLVLYIFTNNVLSIAQSLWFRKFVAPKVAAKPLAPAK
jgi:YidC/Oxa1 family membrane protein insertase